jgi:ABC-type dipeptide/oligopeptide/nickel transport system permease component
VPALLGIYTLVFILLHVVPGDPALLMLSESSASSERLESLRREIGLDRPIHEQYVAYLSALLRGDLGRSIRYNRPVSALIADLFPYTLILMLAALAITMTTGLVLGTVAALYRDRWPDAVSMWLALAGVSLPSFWLGLMLLFVFSFSLGWFPVTEQTGAQRLVLPALTLALPNSGAIARVTRSALLDVLRQDFITTARAKGVPERLVIARHALGTALVPVIAMAGVTAGNLLAGTVVVETVFARPGLGRLTLESIQFKDFPALQSTILFVATCYVIVNLLVDISYGYVDPRIREQGI